MYNIFKKKNPGGKCVLGDGTNVDFVTSRGASLSRSAAETR